MITQNFRLTAIMLTAAFILALPLIAMQFTNEVVWTLADFVIAGILLFGTGSLLEVIFRKVKKTQQRIIWAGVLLFVLFLIWAELAVGIFGSPFAGS
jgi:ABC-type proline/glycine betaine transport system permease subunit